LWKWDVKAEFSVKSYYKFLNFGGISFAANNIWSVTIPLKVKILMWLIVKGELNT